MRICFISMLEALTRAGQAGASIRKAVRKHEQPRRHATKNKEQVHIQSKACLRSSTRTWKLTEIRRKHALHKPEMARNEPGPITGDILVPFKLRKLFHAKPLHFRWDASFGPCPARVGRKTFQSSSERRCRSTSSPTESTTHSHRPVR